MSRGLGQTQHRMLASLAAIQACQPPGASIEDLLVLWGRVEAKTVQDFDYANTYRGLRALERRGLVSFADQANYTVACLCAHASDEHEDGHGRCRSRRNLQGRYWCYCKRYRPERKPRPSWLISLTPVGRGLVRDEEASR
jgi:hypothetical protein